MWNRTEILWGQSFLSVLFPAMAIGYRRVTCIHCGLNKICIQPGAILKQMENPVAKIKRHILTKMH